MDMEVDHYAVLGLTSAANLSLKDIVKAYKSQALKLHPDKRRDDPNAHINFQRLHNSYHVLKDTNTRQLYDHRLRLKHEKLLQDFMRSKMMAKDLAEREARRKRQELAEKKARREEKRRRRKMRMRKELEEERRRLEMLEYFKNKEAAEKEARDEIARFSKDGAQIGLDKEKVLKVSWDRIGAEEDYSVPMLRELFQEFGEVPYVLITSCEIKRGSAFIVMASKDAVVAATRSVVGYLDNPLLVLPLL